MVIPRKPHKKGSNKVYTFNIANGNNEYSYNMSCGATHGVSAAISS